MPLLILIKAVFIGILAALPLGPMGINCLRRSITHGIRSTLSVAAGIALGYMVWVFVIVYGISELSFLHQANNKTAQLLCGIFFILWGVWMLLFKKIKSHPQAPSTSGLVRDFLLAFTVIVVNPATILTITILFTVFGILPLPNTLTTESVLTKKQVALWLSLAVVSGTVMLWLSISLLMKKQETTFPQQLINRIAGLLITIGGIAICLKVVFS